MKGLKLHTVYIYGHFFLTYITGIGIFGGLTWLTSKFPFNDAELIGVHCWPIWQYNPINYLGL